MNERATTAVVPIWAWVTFIRLNCMIILGMLNSPEDECPILRQGNIMTKHRIYTTSFASIYPHYVAKAEKKGRTKDDVGQIICWLTGYRHEKLEAQIERKTDVETLFAEAPLMNPARALIKGLICGVRVEDIEEPTVREIRYLDKLVGELAKGKVMERILRVA